LLHCKRAFLSVIPCSVSPCFPGLLTLACILDCSRTCAACLDPRPFVPRFIGLPLFLCVCLSCNKVLHLDPTVSVRTLQKTSPNMDPADFQHLSTVVKTRATMLASHRFQLTRLTSLLEELASSMQSCSPQSSSTAANQAQAPAAPVPPQPSVSTASSYPSTELPEKFNGSPVACEGFLQQCSLYMNHQPQF
jgi:hypothetical protein